MDDTSCDSNNYVCTSVNRDISFSVELNRWILKPIGVWPNPFSESTKRERCFRRLINAICYGLIAFLMIPCGLHLVLEVKDTYDKVRLTGPLSFCLMAIAKYCSLMMRESDIRRCIRHIERDWKNLGHSDDRRIMISRALLGRRLIIICAAFMYSSAIFYYLAVPLAKGKVLSEEGNFTYRPLVYPVARFLVDARKSPVNEIFVFVQCLSGFVAHSITTGACSLAIVFAMHACGQLQLLTSWLEHLVQGRDDLCDDVNRRIASIVKQHVQVLSFISLTEEILNEISLVEVVGCTLNICFLGYYCITGWEYNEAMGRVTYMILLVSVTFNIFIFCYIGELLAEECKKVGERSYMIDWYRLPVRECRALILVIAMSNCTMKLTAGNLIDLSLSSFGDVIKTSVAYLNMLRSLTT